MVKSDPLRFRRYPRLWAFSLLSLLCVICYFTLCDQLDGRDWCQRGHPIHDIAVSLDAEVASRINASLLRDDRRLLFQDCVSGVIIGRNVSAYASAFEHFDYSHSIGPATPLTEYSFYIGEGSRDALPYSDGNIHVETLSIRVCPSCGTIVKASVWAMIY